MTIRVLHPGLLSSIQDLGRHGYQKYGVVVGGAMDTFAHRIANIIIGNSEVTPTLEITIKGPMLEFDEDTLLSICGGELHPEINGERIPSWKPILAKKGSILRFGRCQKGCRAYLAIAGGFDVHEVMGSYSTYLRAGIGGFKGRALEKGDLLTSKKPSGISLQMLSDLNKSGKAKWKVSSNLLKAYNFKQVRFIPGKEYDFFTKESQMEFKTKEFIISVRSDRMGYRLEGPKLSMSQPLELISQAVTMGTVQVPPDGNPIILMADRQTIGGYPKIAQISQVDFPLLAQSQPGDKIWFHPIDLEKAQSLFWERESEIHQLKKQLERMYV